ncbi:MAG TPA: tRNA (adenosine(37)-N6)-threonylcarbamoyltransferase complex ATPase subunit type 1 TsaE [Solirubrobacteraceae bacterium]|nr:tRNA (adenosine(37)-N6)-threonylcarbamoyltransferase complex ATPase subunit type 1 TsaE [Solirubrobacteraceae bacterium]
METTDSTATEALGADLARSLEPGDVVLLVGDLGAGKTTLVRGAAGALGVVRPVTSPTFAIGNRYPVATRPGLSAVAHLDLYRLGDLGAEDPDLLADYIGADTVAFVEWPGGAEDRIAAFGRLRFRVTLSHLGGDRRRIEVVPA